MSHVSKRNEQEEIEQPQRECLQIHFDRETTLGELVEQVCRVKRGRRIDVIIPPDHPALASAVAVASLGQALGAREGVAAVCGDKEIRLQLKRAGMTVRSGESAPADTASSARAFEAWSAGALTMPRKRKSPLLKKSYVIGAVVAAVTGLFLFSVVLPRAEVVVVVETRDVERRERFTADARVQTAPSDVRHLRGTIAEGRAEVTVRVPIDALSESGTRAEGGLAFENQTGNPVDVSPDTPLTSEDGTGYAVAQAVTIPPATVSEDNSVVFGAVAARARAHEPGVQGNRASGRLMIGSVPAARQSRVYAVIAFPFTGGANRLGKVVSDAHVAQALPQAKDALKEKLRMIVVPDGDDAWWEVEALTMATTTEVQVQPPIGEEADEMTLTLRGTVTALLLSREDVLWLFELRAQDCAGSLCRLAAANIAPRTIASSGAEGELRLERTVRAGIKADDLARRIAGMSVQDARHLVLSTPQVNDVRIILRRSIRGFLPRDAGKIEIRIE